MGTDTEIWPQEKIIAELKRRSGDNRSIKFNGEKDDSALKDSVFAQFGNWTSALNAAGLPPKTKLINCWNDQEVIHRIKEIAEKGESINTLSLEMNHPRLWNAARRIFGNINNAVQAAGFDYAGFKKRGAWTPEKITERLQNYHSEGKDLSQITMLEDDSKLLAAAQKLYGSWSRAVNAAGIDYAQVKARHKELKNQSKTTAEVQRKRKVYVFKSGKLMHPDIPMHPGDASSFFPTANKTH